MRKRWILILLVIVATVLGLKNEAIAYNSPSNGERVYTRRPRLSWGGKSYRGCDYPTVYEVQVSRERGFDSPFFTETINADMQRWVTVDCNVGGTYYWRLRGGCIHDSGNVWGVWENEYFIVDLSLPPAPTPVRPSYSDVVPAFSGGNVVNFEWEPIPGQRGYDIEVSDRRDFSNVVVSKREVGTSETWRTSPSGQIEGFAHLNRGEYYWHVRVRRESGWSEWSRGVNFLLLHKVRLKQPGNGFISRALGAIVEWYPVPAISQYEVQWSRTRDFSSPSSQTTPNTNINIGDLSDETTYYWRVKEQSTLWTETEEVRSFTVRVIPSMPYITQPAPGSKIYPSKPKPTFKWEHIPYAASYRLEVREGTSSGSLVFQASPPAPGIFSPMPLGRPRILSFDSPVPLSAGRYVWLIRACNSRGECSGWRTGEFDVILMKEKPSVIPKSKLRPAIPTPGKNAPIR